jgi:flagellar protein FlaG
MASVSITHLILFIASLLVAASVAGVLTNEVGRLSQAINDQGLDASKDVRTDIEIISDSGSSGSIYDPNSGNVTLYVKNTGTQRLDASADGSTS